MVGLALAFEKGTAYWIAAGGFITEGYLTDAIREVLQKDCQAASFDLKEQLHVLQLPEQKNIWDLSVGAYLINPLKNGYTYDDISNEYLGRDDSIQRRASWKDRLCKGRRDHAGKNDRMCLPYGTDCL